MIIAVIAGEPEREGLIEATRGVDLIAPGSIHWEIGNAFSAMLKRKRITLEQVRSAMDVYQSIPIRFLEVDLRASLEIADRYGIYAYDAYLIECASRFRSPLLSLDKNLVDYAIQSGIEIWEI